MWRSCICGTGEEEDEGIDLLSQESGDPVPEVQERKRMKILIYCHRRKDVDTLQKICRACSVLMKEEELRFAIYTDRDSLVDVSGFWDMLLFEINCGEDLAALQGLRRRAADARLLIAAGRHIPPEWYVIPSLCPDILLRRPYDSPKVARTVHQLFACCYEDRDRSSLQRLVVRSGSEKRYFQYGQVLYLEARDKKLILCSREGFTEFYGSLQEMERTLPAYFIRCHRSYIVNAMYVSTLNLSQGILHISEQYVIPVSKKYKRYVNSRMASIVKDEQ